MAANAESIEDQGGVVLSGTDKHGNRIRLECRVADVHRPLIAGSDAAKNYLATPRQEKLMRRP